MSVMNLLFLLLSTTPIANSSPSPISSPFKIFQKSIYLFMFISMTLTQATIMSHLAHCRNKLNYILTFCSCPLKSIPHIALVVVHDISLLETL